MSPPGRALLAFTLLAIVWTWPLVPHLSTRLPHDAGDPVLNTWILWWNAHAVPMTARWWSPPILIPVRGALALSEHLAGLAVIAAPIQLAGGSPLLAYNVCLLFSYALSGWFTYLLVFRLTGSRLAAACGGVAFATAPYRAGQLAHLQVLSSQWMPAMLLGLHGYVESGRRRWLALFAGAWLVQALSNGYFLLFLPVLVGLWMAWFVDWRHAARRGVAIAAAWAAASVPLLPVLVVYRAVHASLGLSRQPGEIARFSASPWSFLHAPPLLRFWPSSPVPTQEDYLFPGITAVIVIGLALAWRTRASSDGLHDRAAVGRSTLLFYSVAAVILYACAFGPGAEDAGLPAWLRPYRWLALLPGYDGLRVPARFAMPASLCLAVAAGLGVARLGAAVPRRYPAIAALVLAGLGADGLMEGMPLVVPPPRAILPAPADAPVLELPADDARVNVAAMYRAMSHRRPIVNGYSGYTPPHYAILGIALRRGDTSPLAYLARDRPLLILVNDQFDAGGEFHRLVAGLPSIEPLGTSGAGTVFRLPRAPQPALPVSGGVLPARQRAAGRERLEIDLGSTRLLSAARFNLRWHYPELAERLLVEQSADGEVWSQAWLGWTGALAFAGAVEDPLVAPVTIPLDGVSARYLRIYPAPPWLGRELTVLGRVP